MVLCHTDCMTTGSVRVNARLKPKVAAKIARLRQATGETTSEILNRAIEELHDRSKPGSVAEAFAAFVGCGEGDPSLSTNYKAELGKILEEKYGHR